jgi:hypothetical protein
LRPTIANRDRSALASAAAAALAASPVADDPADEGFPEEEAATVDSIEDALESRKAV